MHLATSSYSVSKVALAGAPHTLLLKSWSCVPVWLATMFSHSQLGCQMALRTGLCEYLPVRYLTQCAVHMRAHKPTMLGRQGATYATSQTLVEFKDSALHSLDGTVNAVQACSPA